MTRSLYEYKDYKSYVRDAVDGHDKRGGRSRLARSLNCQTAYISQVLNGGAHFSLEQGEAAGRHLGQTKEQLLYFLLLIQYARAGTPQVRRLFEEQIQQGISRQTQLKNRLEFQKALSPADQATFYSSWHYGAVHVLTAVPGMTSEREIASYLGLPAATVVQILEFLLSVGLVVKKQGRYQIGTTHIHLGADAPLISKHHTNWRLQALRALDAPQANDLHYSSVITCAAKDAPRIRAALVKAIEDVRAIVRPSGDEAAYCYSLDFFGLRAET